jgi:hypothetical protein
MNKNSVRKNQKKRWYVEFSIKMAETVLQTQLPLEKAGTSGNPKAQQRLQNRFLGQIWNETVPQ